ncbi:MAG: CBS domain-containing protein [Ktedonobacteraceae bacterium]
MNVKEVMTTNVITVRVDQTRQEAARLLSQHRISGFPVIDNNGVLLGIVTEYDIISKEGRTVGDIMTHDIISVSADTDLEEVRHILVHERIRRLPVIDQGRLIGIVSRADLVREVATRWVCEVCGEVAHSEDQPASCSRCGARGVAESPEPVPPGS